MSGKVTVDGRPLEQGTVTFIPNKARGNWSRSRPSASIKNGAYEVWTRGKVGAPPGWYRVVVDGFVASQRHGLRSYVLTPGDSGEAKGSWVPSPDPASHFSNYDQPLAIEVTASGDEPAYDLQLTRSRRRH
ncbi:MAG TPA: hypothetical protein VJ739_19320 [Gemmataceae bacterium]|nr:hypothetical protein [Gemmataceae bacterium]